MTLLLLLEDDDELDHWYLLLLFLEKDSIGLISKYEDVSVYESVKGQIELAGCILSDEKDADIILLVNNFKEDFEFKSPNETNSSLIHFYKEESKSYIGEGYVIYNINLEDGFDLKGVITHETVEESDEPRIYSNNNTKLLRGLYIDDNLYTVSEVGIKVNNLETLELVSELKIEE